MNIRLILKRSALLLLPMFALLVGCNEQDPDTISVTDGYVLSEAGEEISVLNVASEAGWYTVYPSTDTWSVVSSEDWCVPNRDNCLSYESNKSLDLYIYGTDHANYGLASGEDSRIAFVTFTHGKAEYTFIVSQGKSSDYITLYPGEATVGYESSTFNVCVAASASWEAYSAVSWADVTFDVDKNLMTVTTEENPSEEPRSTEIVVMFETVSGSSVNTLSEKFVLTQEGRNPSYVTAGVSEYTFAAEPTADLSTTLSTNIYNASFTVSSNQTWCSYTLTDDELEISVEYNELVASRDAKISITAVSEDGTTTATSEIIIYQVGVDSPSISLGTASYTFDSKEYVDQTASYSAVGAMSVSATVDWITDIDATTSGVTYTVAENTTDKDRTATITITATKGGESVSEVITITQTAEILTLTVSTNDIYVDYTGEAITITAASNGSVEFVDTNSTWCIGADGVYTVEKNDTGYERTCTITVVATLDDQTLIETVTVTQGCISYDL
ncbi:MAG: BACON domain-containing carbohydrate-binding protein [Rikenellaceae bacterium]